jgi:hypothetical protein
VWIQDPERQYDSALCDYSRYNPAYVWIGKPGAWWRTIPRAFARATKAAVRLTRKDQRRAEKERIAERDHQLLVKIVERL